MGLSRVVVLVGCAANMFVQVGDDPWEFAEWFALVMLIQQYVNAQRACTGSFSEAVI